MKIANRSTRSFIVSAKDVLQGGEASIDKKQTYINPGSTVEVTQEIGEFLATYANVEVLDSPTPVKKGRSK